MNTLYPTLVRRELWEHRALWLAPVIVAGLLVLVAMVSFLPSDVDQLNLFSVTQIVSGPHYLVMLVVLFFYLLDTLYTERRDRSILFWKSMPVSDTATVGSKLFVATVLVPLGVFAMALVTDLLVSLVWTLRIGVGRAISMWDTATFLHAHTSALAALIVTILWYLPVMAYLLLISAWAKRNAFLWAVLPPVAIVAIEAVALDTSYASTFLAYRLGGGLDHISFKGIPNPFHGFGILPVLTNVDLWLGIVVAAGLVYAAIYVRRYRDDT